MAEPMSQAPRASLQVLALMLLAILCAYGAWTGYVWAATWAGWSFVDLVEWVWVLVPAVFAAVFVAARAAPHIMPVPDMLDPGSFGRVGRRTALGLAFGAAALLGAALVLILLQPRSFLLPWVLLAASGAVAAAALARGVGQGAAAVPAAAGSGAATGLAVKDWLLFALYGAICIAAYLYSANTDADDTHFLGAAVGLLRDPAAPLFAFDSLFGETEVPNYIFVLNRGQSLEALAALVSHLGAIDPKTAYYLVIPIMFLPFCVVPVLLLTAIYFPRHAWLGAFFALAVMLIWSTDNLLSGDFFIPRFFQGKSLFVTIVVPTIFLVTRALVRAPSGQLTAVLCLVLVAGAGTTSSALYLGLVVAGLGYLAFVPFRRREFLLATVCLGAASVPNLAMLLDTYLHVTGIAEVDGVGRVGGDGPRDLSIYGVFGGGKELAAFMLLTFAGFVVIWLVQRRDPRLSELTRLWLVLILFAVNRPLAEVIAGATGISNVSWRWHWVYPAPVVLSLLAAGAAFAATAWAGSAPAGNGLLRLGQANARWMLRAGLVVFCLAFLALNAPLLARKYGAVVQPWKVNPDALAVATQIMARDRADQVVLADEPVAQILGLFPRRGRQISLRGMYFSKPYFEPAETAARVRLYDLVNRPEQWSAGDVRELAAAIRRRGITTLALRTEAVAPDRLSSLAASTDLRCAPVRQWTVCQPE